MCTALQLSSDIEQPWLMSKHDIINKLKVYNVSLSLSHSHRYMHKKFADDQTCSSEDMIADRQTYTHRQTDTLITILCSPIRGRVKTAVTGNEE